MPGLAEYHATLRESHRHYAWKMGLRALLVAVDIALIAMVAWVLDEVSGSSGGFFDYWDDWILAFDYIPIGCSFIFCLIVIAYQMLRKRPVHPGWDVGVDLIIWLMFAVMGGFTITVSISYFDGYYGDSYDTSNIGNSSGYYITAANGTQVWVPPNSDNQCAAFTSCAEQQAFYDSIQHRGNVEMAIFALMMLAMLLHFALFVWGCVDTSRRNSSKVSRDARNIAQSMIAEMVANGQIPPPQQPLLYPGPSQRDSQVGSHSSQEASQGAPPHQQAPQPASYGYYAPEVQGAPMQQQQQHGAWPLQDPAAGQTQPMNEKRMLAANMPPPPRQGYMPAQSQAAPYAQSTQGQTQAQRPQTQPVLQPLSPISPLSPIDASGRAESPTIPEMGLAAGAAGGRRHSSTSPRPTSRSRVPRHNKGGPSISSDALVNGPTVPARAPGHTATASRRVSSASGSLRQTLSNDASSQNQF